jgi:hypothetical protein
MGASSNPQEPSSFASVRAVSLYELFANYGEKLPPSFRIILHRQPVFQVVDRDRLGCYVRSFSKLLGRGGEIRTPDLVLPRHAPSAS